MGDISYVQFTHLGPDIIGTDEERKAIADVIAETEIDTQPSDAVLTTNGYANREVLKDALVKIDSNARDKTLRAMLRDGALIYKAVYQHEIVGVVVIIRLIKEFSTMTNSQKRPPCENTPFPDPSDLRAVEAYARSGDVDEQFYYQLCGHLNTHLHKCGIGHLWELSALGVKKEFRHRNIGRTLVRHALSHVPYGDTVIVQTEQGKEAMFRHLGFQQAMSKPNTRDFILVKPEWEKEGKCVVLPMMTFNKER